MSDTDIVYFLMPDGTKVSNDPRWLAAQSAEAAAELLGSTPYTGNEGIADNEMLAQVGGGLAPGQSGQPGVGESPTATLEEILAGKNTGAVLNPDAAALAADAGFDAVNPGSPSPEASDSNEAVLAAREKAAKAAAALTEAGEELGDPDVPYSDWSAKQLKAEALRRNAERGADNQLSFTGVKNKSQLVALLEADNLTNA